MAASILVWFRRDLRDHDHAALAAALAEGGAVHCVFVFDVCILTHLADRKDRRLSFIHASLAELDAALRARGGNLIVLHGDPVAEIPRLARHLGVAAVFANRDYEPYAKARDTAVARALAADGREFASFRDHVIVEGTQLLTQAGRPYTVFTPYRNAWLKRVGDGDLAPHASTSGQLAATPSGLADELPPLATIGFDAVPLGMQAGMSGADALFDDFCERIDRYRDSRDYPAVKGVSYLSAHLRFGTISIRRLAAHAWRAWQAGSDGAFCWLSELVWRDFYFMILDAFPHVVESSFRPEYDAIGWDDWPAGLEAWQSGMTGYPLVDAAMRQLASSGYMHNRLRMVSASFLCKDLGIDWRHGESWFAAQLLDFDLAANNGGWQWAASSGCDAQPWFRIFNPVTQSEKFDPQGRFIRRYVPELAAVPDKWIHAPWRMPPMEQQACGTVIGRDYPQPIVDHDAARQKTLARYAVVKKAG